jgi:pSer/pThr/pTyr-binding forkhead associated (FHA) protein
VPGTRVVARSALARDQGEPMSCPFCGGQASGLQPFCPHCGRRLTAPGSGPNCPRCASPVEPGIKFCATCGTPLADVAAARRGLSGPWRAGATIALVLLDDLGSPVQRFERTTPDTTIGRQDGDIRFPEDVFLSPLHAKLSWEEGTLVVRDLGSRNGTWVFLEEAHRLLDGDLLLIGSQVIRFRRLGYPGPHPPDADATKRMGSLIPSADIASLTQLRSDGSVRDVIQLSPGRDVAIGREQGDWVFPYDPSMSARHALVRSEDADFVVVDANSRNGIALAARGDMALRDQSRILVGDKLLRIEIPT